MTSVPWTVAAGTVVVQYSSASRPNVDDKRLGAFFFAPGRNHPARMKRTAEARARGALDDLDRRVRLGEFVSAGEAGDAGAEDTDRHAAPPRSFSS